MIRSFIFAAAAVLLCVGASAQAQSLSPMRANVLTFGEMGAVRASLRNPYTTARRFDIEVYGTNWQKIDDVRLTRQSLALGPGSSTSILALVPVGGSNRREVYVCASSRPYRPSSAGLRGQVCGRYQLIKRAL